MSGEAPECVRFAEALRELRGRTELSLAALAAKTAFSKSSWERYLNGRKLPPRSAVEALCRVAGVPAARYMALWELAEVAWSGRGARDALAQPDPRLPRPPDTSDASNSSDASDTDMPWWRRPSVMVTVATGVVVCALVVVLTTALWPTGEPPAPARAGARTVARQVLCHGAGCTGQQPLATGCGDVEVQGAPKVLRTLRRSGVEVQIRYKPECGAAWVRVSGQHVGDRFEVSAPGVAAQRLVIEDKWVTGMYRSSPMVAVQAGQTEAVRACAEFAGSGARECFRP